MGETKTAADKAKKSTNAFSEFIRNAKSDEKKRVYATVLSEASKQQNEVIAAAKAKAL
ncbi:hypothetical protein [Pseudomonas sp. USHLN015]|uniref:hypothetical protein n=1 Tax=Pseudomonas sp. USHLN015 TaxID=3081296 RepID=UPI00301D0056